jgi:DNA-binding CsgD family transcriptional regulator
MIAESPTPDLPRGAGGPQSRAAGRGTGTALVLDPDPLGRLLVAPAVLALGFRAVTFTPAPAGEPPAAVFVALGAGQDCGDARRAAASAGTPVPVAGYAAAPAALLAAHRAHGCCDLVLRLDAVAGRPRLEHLAASDPVTAAGLSVREADVLVLLLRGLTTPAIAARLCVAQSTARSHCRAVLRKLDAPDRRALRAALLAPPSGPPAGPLAAPSVSPTACPATEPQICRTPGASFAEESPVVTHLAALHT